MKKFLLSLSLAASTVGALPAADYVPMIREDRVWEYVGPDWDNLPEQYMAFHYMKFDGTVSVNDHEYHRLVIFKTKRYTAPIGSDGSVDWSISQLTAEKNRDDVIALMREDNGKVFRLMYDNGCIVTEPGTVTNLNYTEDLIYDWTLEDGETFTVKRTPDGVDNETDITVAYSESVNIAGETCRVMDTGLLDVRLIEGIGPDKSGSVGEYWLDLMLSLVYNNSRRPWLGSVLNRVFDGVGNVVYQNEDVAIPPSPTYVPMIREDRVWEYVGTFLAPDACGNVFHYMKFDGTMDVQGTEYHKFVLFKSIFESDGEYIKGSERQEPYYLLREEEGKLYVLCQNDEIARNYNPGSQNATENLSEFKLYDFTLSNGEVIEYPICSWEVSQNAERLNFYVNVFSPLEIDGERCRLMALSREPVDNPDYDYSFPVRIIEGIGATYNGSLVNFCLEMFGSIFDSSYEPTYYSTINRVLDLDGNVVYGEGSAPPNSVDGITVDGALTVSWTDSKVVAVADGDAVVTIEVIGIDGAKRATAAGRGQAAADLSQLASGVYVVRASDGSSVKTAKIMINDYEVPRGKQPARSLYPLIND